jgi:PAS domain S-box-containing protein
MTRRNPAKIVHLPWDPGQTVEHAVSAAVSTLEKALLTREEWLRLAAQGSQLGLWYWNEVNHGLFWDVRTREIFGVNVEGEVTLDTFYKALHPDDLERVKQIWRYQLESGIPCDLEYRAQRPDGSIRWIHARGSGYYDSVGNPLYIIGVIFDVTERKQAEQERLELSGRLINAQEQERSHLARELHDDFGQRLSLVASEMSRVAEMMKGTDSVVSEQVEHVCTFLSDVISDLHLLSHRLHSSKLESMGLVESVRSTCEEFSRQCGTRVQFAHKDIPKSISSETALCLFRIVQEGLHNVGKHSQASRAAVRLTRTPEGISLTMSDNGVGFDLAGNYVSRGIGIQSMKERTRMLGGTLEVLSRPQHGTQIAVTLPLKSLRAA